MENTENAENSSLVDLYITGRKERVDVDVEVTDNDDQPFELYRSKISVPESTPLSVLWKKFAEAGFKTPDYISCSGKDWYRKSTKVQVPPSKEIEVVQDRPSEFGKCIHIDDSLISYTNLTSEQSLKLNISDNASDARSSRSNSLKTSQGLEIRFHRTVRMPDDDKLHQLPSSLGELPLHNVVAYADALPDNIVRDGGVFMPMWQREALWVDLSAKHSAPYALRLSIGRINAVSGLPMDEVLEETADNKPLQDYLVVPGQKWIDGICVAPGVVRQFVAMPLGSGYTVEGQKTGEEKHGGLQIEIIPSFERSLQMWLRATDASQDADALTLALLSEALDELKTPLELGLSVGTTISSFPPMPHPRLDCVVSDILKKDQSTYEVELSYYYHGSFGSTPVTRAKNSTYPGLFVRRPPTSVGMGKQYNSITTELRPFRFDTESDLGSDSSYSAPQEVISLTQHADNEPISMPHIKMKNLDAMGLAAGGKLVQDIYQDHNPPRVWDQAAARIVHVHILEPMSCEAVTHIVPPPPPVDARSYAEAGGQFFVIEEQPEDRLEGGDFENVKSVSAIDKEKTVPAEPALDPNIPMQCKCGIRMCDCVVRPCGHVFCNVCIREIDHSELTGGFQKVHAAGKNWICLTCNERISWVAGFAAPMNLPGEEGLRMRVPVNVLKVKDGRIAFQSIQRSRI